LNHKKRKKRSAVLRVLSIISGGSLRQNYPKLLESFASERKLYLFWLKEPFIKQQKFSVLAISVDNLQRHI